MATSNVRQSRRQATETKARYTPKSVPANSFVTSDSPLNTTTHVKVRRWCGYHGTPLMFQVVDRDGRVLRWFPYEPDALAHCEAIELELGEPEPDAAS